MVHRILVVLVLCLALLPLPAQTTYQKPPQAVLDVLHAPEEPMVNLNPSRTHVLLLERERYPSIAEVSQPMLRLAGWRINPRNNGPHRAQNILAISVKPLAGGAVTKIQLPPGARIFGLEWSPDGRQFAFLNRTATSIELWVGQATGAARRIEGVAVNAATGRAQVDWMPGSRTLLARLVPAGRGPAPLKPAAPAGPNTQESAGNSGPVRTYQDMLTSPHDEVLFDYYATAQLAVIDTVTGTKTLLGAPAIYETADASPDGKHLLVSRVRKPYSYLQPSFAFPKDVEVWDLSGKVVHKLASLPMADNVPIEGVSTGPRGYHWRPTEPATLVWTEALDGGNPRNKVPHRDRILLLKAPFAGQPVELFKTEHRAGGGGFRSGGPVSWGERDGLVLIKDYERNRRWSRTFALNADRPSEPARLLWSLSSQDRYRDPGAPVMRVLPSGHRAILMAGENIYLDGAGAGPEGDRPFLDRYNLKTQQTERLFRSEATAYEQVVALLDDGAARILTRRESPTEPPNFLARTLQPASVAAITSFKDPTPQLRAIKKQLVTYKRSDGVPLSFTLYLPPGYKEGTRLPTVVWAYPLEYNDADTAGQVVGSTQRFTRIGGASHLFYLLAGYAILDGATLPVIGDPETVNNTYLEQIALGAKAAIDKAVEMGVTDRLRVGVGGHSYGGFMTANLLAHTDLFRAGIARSGAHNRTLTPFGFQSERRTLWEAPDVYLKMSPFLNANKIKEPILFIHGEADNNQGTFPIQSERMYAAVRGNGGTTRLVMLPHESHGYEARESIEHTLYEMISWFNRHVKDAPPLSSAAR